MRLSDYSAVETYTQAAQQALAVDAASRPRDRAYFETRFRLDCHLDLDCGATEARHGRPRENAISNLE